MNEAISLARQLTSRRGQRRFRSRLSTRSENEKKTFHSLFERFQLSAPYARTFVVTFSCVSPNLYLKFRFIYDSLYTDSFCFCRDAINFPSK